MLHGQIVEMNHTNTGPTASAWSNANNWLPTDVPRTLLEVQISNGGEAVVDVSVVVCPQYRMAYRPW